ncbi:hypothetical protein HF521_021859 [Silurus meridionalis]|uniref:Saposin B-type domain-containing protein n=1 Tax=Silurus meridionalis TaxID=175797 RepID=A0A8T0BG25_SILME|nr:hypothetical protein HF521_021859 [Silurus meridionalis]
MFPFTVILKCESRRHEKRDRTETLTLPELGTTTHPTGNHSRNGKVKIPGSCFLCKTIIKALFNYVRKRYSQETDKLCYKFLPKYQDICLTQVWKLKPFIMKRLFPASAPEMCAKYRACRY